MSRGKNKVDRLFLISVIALIVIGFVTFYSTSLGLLARSNTQYLSVTFSQAVLGFCLGSLAMYLVSRLNYKVWRKWALPLLIFAIILNILVLIPEIGLKHNGARRWLIIGNFSLQPSEILKLAFVVYFSAWVARTKGRVEDFREGLIPLLVLLSICGGLLLKQPDTDTFLMLVLAGLAIFFVAGGKWKHLFFLFLIGIVTFAVLTVTRPYLMKRVTTYFNPSAESAGASYQVQQSLIAIGSGGLFGRGFGQSLQKFKFLPEPVGDSIFAVQAEEFGFFGSTIFILCFLFFSIRGLKISSATDELFGRLLVLGLVIMITAQAFLNIGSMLGILPLSGITLPFVSQGGTSLFFTLLEMGIILSVSRSISKSG